MSFRSNLLLCVLGVTIAFSFPAAAMTLREAVERAVTTNPRVLEAAANRRSVDHELGEAFGAYMPTLDLDASIGPQFVDQPQSLSTSNNRVWRTNREASLVARHTFFQGFARANEVYRQSARVDGAAARVMERAELIALDTVETFLDVHRHRRILKAARENTRIHQALLQRVRTRYQGGSSTEGELRQAEERVSAAEAVHADVIRELKAAEARFEAVVGVAPRVLEGVGVPRGLPKTQGAAILAGRSNHPALQAGGSDVRAAEASYDKTKSPFFPRIGVEGRAKVGEDQDGTPGINNDFSVRLTMSWNIFNGGIDSQRKLRESEKLTETRMKLDQLRRTVDETVRRSWTDIGANDLRLKALRQQTTAARAVIVNYNREFDAGLRSLLDLLIAQNSAFNAQVQMISSETISVFSRYRLFAATGQLLAKFNVAPPADSARGTEELPWFVGSESLIEPLRKW